MNPVDHFDISQLQQNLGFSIPDSASTVLSSSPSEQSAMFSSRDSYQSTHSQGQESPAQSPKSASSSSSSGKKPTLQFGTDANFTTGRRYSPPSEQPTYNSIERRYENAVGCLHLQDQRHDGAASSEDSSSLLIGASAGNANILSQQNGRGRKRRKSNKDAANGGGSYEAPLPPEERRRATHIAAERNRRIRLRDAFAELCDIVPGLNQGGWSKKEVLQESADWLQSLLEGNDRLKEQLRELKG